MKELLPSGDIPGGYHGKYLRIDATSGRGEFISIEPTILRQFIGGSGLGTWLLLKEGAAEQEPLGPEAAIAFVFSPLVGSPLTTSAKFAVVSKSPLTSRINDSLASSGFAIAGKKAGCDTIVITGRAPDLSILVIDEGMVRFEPAENLRGTSCPQAEKVLHQKYPGYSFAVIGPAGENLVRYATISHDGRHAGRGGSGAVLGAKNIKAVAIRGTQRTQFAHPQELVSLAKNFSERSFGPATTKYRELGTATNLLVFNRLKALPTRNFQAGSFAQAEAIAPETLTLVRDKTRASCAACTIGCEHIYSLRPGHTTKDVIHASDNGSQDAGVRLEYENLFALGPLCGISDPQVVLTASKKCDELGLDTISAGGTIAFAMECVERGLLHEPWLKFGDGNALLKALDLIGSRRGFGNRLSEGSRHLAMSLGGNALEFAPQVKGLELPGYEPRALQSMALGFAVGSRGADHNRSGAYEVDFSEQADRRNLVPTTALLAIETEDKAALMDSLILCKFLRGIFSDFFAETADMLRLVTGWEVTADELRDVARRVVNAKKLFNQRAGWTAAEDTLPERFLSQTLSDDPAAHLSREQLSAAVAAYYQVRGWSSDGTLDAAAMASLGLE